MASDTSDHRDIPETSDTNKDHQPSKSPGRTGRASIQGHLAEIPAWKGSVDYSSVDDPRSDAIGPGRDFTSAHKDKLREHNREMNNGLLRSDLDGSVLDEPTKGSRDNNQAEVDHKIPQHKGGWNTSDNAQILSKGQNRDKGDQ